MDDLHSTSPPTECIDSKDADTAAAGLMRTRQYFSDTQTSVGTTATAQQPPTLFTGHHTSRIPGDTIDGTQSTANPTFTDGWPAPPRRMSDRKRWRKRRKSDRDREQEANEIRASINAEAGDLTLGPNEKATDDEGTLIRPSTGQEMMRWSIKPDYYELQVPTLDGQPSVTFRPTRGGSSGTYDGPTGLVDWKDAVYASAVDEDGTLAPVGVVLGSMFRHDPFLPGNPINSILQTALSFHPHVLEKRGRYEDEGE